MKFVTVIFALLLILTACQPHTETNGHAEDIPQEAYTAAGNGDVTPEHFAFGSATEETDNKLHIGFEELNVPIYIPQQFEIMNVTMPAGMFCFSYSVGSQQGSAELYPGYLNVINDFDDLRGLSFEFEYSDNIAYLKTNWDVNGIVGTDTFRLHEKLNLWVLCRDGIDIYPTLLTRSEADRLFSGTDLVECSLVTLACFETVYKVLIYEVGDVPEVQEPKLLAEYSQYDDESSFLWQSDVSRPKHLTIVYTNALGEEVIYIYRINGGKNIDGTSVTVIAEPDWPNS